MNHLLILGAHGQVGGALTACARRAGMPHRALGRAECDITDPAALGDAVRPGALVINCAAYTAVDRAEGDSGTAYRVNATGAENVASACAKVGAPLIHVSTDYVFDGGKSQPWREDDPTQPLSVYGKSKLAGERAVQRRLSSHIILRTSWIFSAHGENFVRTMLRLAGERRQLSVVNDQIGGPTAADDVAQTILRIVAGVESSGFSAWGAYHFCGTPPVSWHGFACAILAGRDTIVQPIPSEDYPRPAPRPLHSVLDCRRLLDVFGIAQPEWRPSLREVLTEIESQSDRAADGL
jgi:dTDP-4-dehydrorhamnose reductase